MFSDEKSKEPIQERKLHVVTNHTKLDPQRPIPIQAGSDTFAIVKGRKYIPFLGTDNNLPNFLLDTRLICPTQNQCISAIASSVVGNGINIIGVDPKNVDKDFFEWMKSVNNYQDSFDDILYDTIDGEREQGNQFIEIVKGSVGGKPFMKIYLHPFQYCRFAALEPSEIAPSAVVITKLFAKRGHRGRIDDARRIPLWSPNPLDQKKCWFEETDGTLRTMLHFKNKRAGIDYYGMPESVPCLRYQVAEGLLIQYNIDNIENNMVPGGMLKMKSAMTEQEAILTAEKIIESHIGQGKVGRIAVLSSENGIDDVEFIKYDTRNEGSFLELDKAMERKIIGGNGWHKVLLGMDEGGGSLGNGNNYIRSIWYSKEAQLLNPLRRKITDKVVMPLMKIYADVYNKPEILKYTFWFNSSLPFSFLGDIKPELYIKVKEAREAAGLPVDDSVGEKYLSEMVKVQTPQPDLVPSNKPTNGINV